MVDRAQIINVVIASPGDLEAERMVIADLFVRWNSANRGIHLTPIMWETASVPTYGDHPQHIINEQIIEKGDLLVALFWTKIGSPTPTAPSATIEEIREFAHRKGPKRVMVYFCTRPLTQSPDDIDYGSLALLKEFKHEVKSQCLYCEFRETADFEKNLYHHLDIKTDELLRGLLPIPNDPILKEQEDIWWNEDAADERLRSPIDFGSSIGEIAFRFSQQMAKFEAEGGATNNRFFALGAHVYHSIARSIDRIMRSQPYALDVRSRRDLADSVSQLRVLAGADSSAYLRNPPEFWKQGRVISNSLSLIAERNSSPNNVS